MNVQPDRHKHALVTGGNKGIGFAICQGLLTAGFEVTLASVRDKDFRAMTPSFVSTPPSNEFGANSKSSLKRTK